MSHLLLKAAEQGNVEKVRKLLDGGDDIEWRHKGTGRTALVSAAIAGQRDVVELLIQRGANMDQQCSAVGYASLAWASELGLTEMADLLIKRGAQLDLPSPELKRTALMAAAQSGHTDVVRLLLNQGANVELVDFEHENAWSLAADRGHQAITELLASAGATAPITPKAAPILPWPERREDVPATAEPAMVVHAYMLDSADWEKRGLALLDEVDSVPDVFWQEADDILARYCTRRERVYKRMGVGWPPEYAPEDALLSVRQVAARVEVLVTDAPRDLRMSHEHLFVLKQAHGEWRIDSVKKRMRGTTEWQRGIL